MTLEKDFISEFKTFSDRWPSQIRQSILTNLDGFVSESGFMGEFLASLITGKKGTASAGSGFDLSDGNKADEAKLAVLARASICNKCGSKVLFFKEKCTCGSTKFRSMGGTSRFGIDSKAGIKYKEQLDKYVLQTIKPTINSFDCREFIYEAFLVDANNEHFTEYLTNQHINSTKSNMCNLLPYSYDFYRAEPIKVISLKITLNKFDSNIESLYYKLDNFVSEPMPFDVLTRDDIKSILKSNSITFKNTYSKIKLIELVKLNINASEINSSNFQLKAKNLNKDRGVTKRKI